MPSLSTRAAAALLLTAIVSSAAFAQTDHGAEGHGATHGEAAAAQDDPPSSAAYRAANDRMHAGMSEALTGDADVDFARGMIPHHQGAIDMSEIVLRHGDDPELRALAERIVAAQEAEIAFLRDWLARRGE